MLMQQQNCSLPPMLIILIAEFWLSGLFIMSLIFTQSDQSSLEQLNLWMFISLGTGSLLGGYASDFFNRILVFKVFATIWGFSSFLMIINPWAGYIVAAGCIGLLNNLTFVIIMEKFEERKDQYIIYVLMGWAFSEITLGIYFQFFENNFARGTQIFYYLLLGLGLLLAAAVLIFFEHDHQEEDQDILNQLDSLSDETEGRERKWYQRLVPHSIQPLIGGCILMFVMQMFYYRTQFTLDKFGISLPLNTIVVGFTELLADIIFTKLIDKAPRRLFIRILLVFLMALFLLLIIFSNKLIQTVIEGIMRLFDASIMIILGVYLPELFDQDERGKGTNYIMSFGVLGSALNGIILNKLKFYQLIFFLVVAFASTFLFKEVPAPRHKSEN